MRRQHPQPERAVDAPSPGVPATARRIAAHGSGASHARRAFALAVLIAALPMTPSHATMRRPTDDSGIVLTAHLAGAAPLRAGSGPRREDGSGPARARGAGPFGVVKVSAPHATSLAATAAAMALFLALLVASWLHLRRTRRGAVGARRLATIARQLTDGVALADRNGVIEWVNDALPGLTGRSREWLTGRPLPELVESGSAEAKAVTEAVARAMVVRTTTQVRTPAGVNRWFEIEVAPVRGASGEVEQVIARMRDVHDRVQAARDRLEGEERFRSVLAAMSDGLLLWEPGGAVPLCNPAAEKILGLPADQLTGRTARDPRWRAIRPDGTPFPGDEHPAMRTLATGEPLDGVVMGVHRPQGDLAWIRISTRPVFGGDRHEITGAVATFADITDRHAAEDLVRTLSRAVAQSPAMVMIFDHAGNMEYVNDRIEPMLGYRRDEVVGRNPRMFGPGDTPDEVYGSMRSTLLAGHEWRGEVRGRRRDGRAITIALSIFPLRDEHGVVTHHVATGQDVTDQRARESELARAHEAALAAVRAKSEFLQNMSHELRTPMNGILGITELLLGGERTGVQRGDLIMLKRSAEQLTAAIGQIFDFSRLESGAADAASEAFRLPACVREVHDAFAVPAEARGVTFRLELSEALPDTVVGDPGGLRQVLRNLLDNAIKFTDRGMVTLRVSPAPSGPGSGDHVRFAVVDTGVGIPAERQAVIFEAFQQADRSSTRRYGGIGLGLTIAAQIVRRMGGRLEVLSTPGSGSEFGFTLAFRRAGTAGPPPAHAVSTPATASGARVLVLDAGGSPRTGLAITLARSGVEVDVVAGVAEALEPLRRSLAEGRPYRALVYEQRAGGLDGFTAAGELRSLFGPSLPAAMMLTAGGQRGDAGRCHDLGILAYLAEPVDDGLIGEALHCILGADPAAPGALVTRHLLRESRPVVRVLLVDDNAVNRKVASRLLERSGCEVEQAVNGRDAIARWSAGAFDAILMDIQMPEMDGLEATRAIRAIEAERGGPPTPIIALTAHTLDDDRRAVAEAGMDDFVAKPIQADLLLAVLRRLTTAGTAMVGEDAAPPSLREVLDWDEALERMDGDAGVLAEILGLFLQDAPRMLRALEDARRSGDSRRIERAAHGLKGASATISARTVAPLALEVERHAREGRLTEAIDGVDDLRRELHRLVRALEALPDVGRKAA